MKMHFRAYTIKIIIIVFSIFAVNTSDASTASEVFRKNRSQILSQDIAFFQSYVFSKGTALPATESANSSTYAKRKAKHNAFLILSDYIVAPNFAAGTELPTYLSSKLVPKVREELVRSTGSYLVKLNGVSTVYSDFSKNQAIVVIAVRKEEIEHLKPSGKIDFNQFLNEKICARSAEVDPFLAYEICPEQDHAAIMDSIYSHLSSSYGTNVAKAINSDPINNFFDIWVGQYEYRDNFNYSTLKNLTLDEVLVILNAMPYDPLISYTAGDKLRESGFIKTACLFNKAGTKLFFSGNAVSLNYEYLAICKTSDSLPDLAFFEKVGPAISEAYSTSNKLFSYEAEFIIRSLGTIPCTETKSISKFYYKGNKFYENKEFDKALEIYFFALEESVTADLLNMIGMTLIRLNDHKLAIPFLRQALSFNPAHKFAGVNLTEAFLYSNFREFAIATYESTLKNSNIDQWGAYKLRTLKEML